MIICCHDNDGGEAEVEVMRLLLEVEFTEDLSDGGGFDGLHLVP